MPTKSFFTKLIALNVLLIVTKQSVAQNQNLWTNLHQNYQEQSWINRPSLFAQTAIAYFNLPGTVLDLGAGQGQDSRFFAEHGYSVISTDVSDAALELNKAKTPAKLQNKITIEKLDLSSNFNFPDQTCDIVYAHLSLHYFDTVTTIKIFNTIRRILKPNGILALLVNSDADPEYKTGQQIEEGFCKVGQGTKRYFNVTNIKPFVCGFEPLLLDNLGQTYKDSAKGINGLIRFIGKKS